MKTFLTVLANLTALLTWAADEENFRLSAIPASLIDRKTHAVIRHYETNYTVLSAGESIKQIRIVTTILNDKGDDHASLQVPYDRLSKVLSIEGVLYDANGKVIQKLKKSEVEDVSAGDKGALADDNRMKVARFSKLSFPCTVEFRFAVNSKNLMFYPQWLPQPAENTAVEQATFSVFTPSHLPLRYVEQNLKQPVNVQEDATGKHYSWRIENLASLEIEPFSPPLEEYLPMVITAPTAFEIQNYTGTLRTWADIGQFYATLNKGRDALPEAAQQEVRQLVANEKTVVDKVRKLYDHLQKTTRYVSIQLGIGGWQTIDAATVSKNHYGDCKALTNYMKAMLSVVNVPAHEVLIRAGDNEADIRPQFPSFQFNHVLLCVPDGRDTLWLECTSQREPMNYLGNFTGNRHALLVLPQASKVIKTPSYRYDQNRQHRRMSVTVDETGNGIAKVITHYTGLQQEAHSRILHTMHPTEQKEWLIKNIPMASFELTRFDLKETTTALPAVTETLDLAIRQCVTKSGNRLFVKPNLLTTYSPLAPQTQSRRTAVFLDAAHDFEDVDTVTYQVPKGYILEAKPAPFQLESPFGTYYSNTEVTGNQITYIRRVRMNQGRYPATAYENWADFRKKIARADNAQCVFIKSLDN